jgi:hypothetical protein
MGRKNEAIQYFDKGHFCWLLSVKTIVVAGMIESLIHSLLDY